MSAHSQPHNKYIAATYTLIRPVTSTQTDTHKPTTRGNSIRAFPFLCQSFEHFIYSIHYLYYSFCPALSNTLDSCSHKNLPSLCYEFGRLQGSYDTNNPKMIIRCKRSHQELHDDKNPTEDKSRLPALNVSHETSQMDVLTFLSAQFCAVLLYF